MLTWAGILFVLGIIAFLDSFLNMGEIFRRVNSVIFLLVSLGLLIRTTMKMKTQKFEHYEKKIYELEREVKDLKTGRQKLGQF